MGSEGTTEYQAVFSYLTGLWTKILRKEVQPTDDFFEVGGDSLSAVRMIVEVQKAYDVQIELEVFFESPSLEKLASTIVTQSEAVKPHGHA
jgi:Acyl carrier protein